LDPGAFGVTALRINSESVREQAIQCGEVSFRVTSRWDFALYTSERSEMTSQWREAKESQNKKE